MLVVEISGARDSVGQARAFDPLACLVDLAL
jgi:hypothetical protein